MHVWKAAARSSEVSTDGSQTTSGMRFDDLRINFRLVAMKGLTFLALHLSMKQCQRSRSLQEALPVLLLTECVVSTRLQCRYD